MNATSDHLERNYRVAFSLAAVLATVVLLWLAVSAVVAAVAARPLGEGLGAALPFGILATLMTISWLPLFMPFLIPIAAVVIVLAMLALLVTKVFGTYMKGVSAHAAHRTRALTGRWRDWQSRHHTGRHLPA
jgi:hypothetical protein